MSRGQIVSESCMSVSTLVGRREVWGDRSQKLQTEPQAQLGELFPSTGGQSIMRPYINTQGGYSVHVYASSAT